MRKKTLLALTAAGLTMAAAASDTVSISTMTKQEQKAWFIKNKTNEYVKAGHSRSYARTLARLAYQNSLKKKA